MGTTLASAAGGNVTPIGGENSIILWDVESGQPLSPPLTGHARAVRSVAFSPDGKTLASGSADRTIIFWEVGLELLQTRACSVALRNLTGAEWKHYFGNEPYRTTCPDIPVDPAEYE